MLTSKKISARSQRVSSFHVMDVMSRAKALEEKGKIIVHMEVGEPDFPTAQPILDAGKEFLEGGKVHYTTAQGLPALRKKIVQFYKVEYKVDISADQVFITPGASGALTVALALLLDEGREVLMADPGYPCNSNLTALFSAVANNIPVSAEQSFQLTATDVLQAWSDKTQGVMIASPSNPTGTLMNAEQMKALLEVINDKSGFLISDEIYHGLVYEDRAVSALEFSDDVFVLNSFSKFYGMTGWRLGWLIVPKYAIDAANRLIQNLYIAAPTQSQYAALVAFDKGTKKILMERKEEFKARRDYLFNGLKELGFIVSEKPQGAFYIYADCSPFSDDSYAFSLALLNEAGVAVTPGIDFGGNNSKRYLRFAYMTSIEQIELGLARIRTFLKTRV